MIYLFIKFTLIFNLYMYLYIIFKKIIIFLKNMYSTYSYIYYLFNLMFNLNMYVYLYEMNLFNMMIKNFIVMFSFLNFMSLKIIFFIEIIFDKMFLNYLFIYLNKYKKYKMNLKILMLKLYMNTLMEHLMVNSSYYKYYSLYLYKSYKDKFYGLFSSLDHYSYVLIYYIVMYIYNIYHKLLNSMMNKYDNSWIYKSNIVFWYYKLKKIMKNIYFYFMSIMEKKSNKMNWYLFLCYSFMLYLYSMNNVYYYFFFLFLCIMEYILYFSYKFILFFKKSVKK